eukprot:COSAG02_NODE_171_length_31397_cov_27.217554_24_plen_88_part_00
MTYLNWHDVHMTSGSVKPRQGAWNCDSGANSLTFSSRSNVRRIAATCRTSKTQMRAQRLRQPNVQNRSEQMDTVCDQTGSGSSGTSF